jgi:cytochrome c oxidase subunit 1
MPQAVAIRSLYQHIFWFFGHPEVYILILPAFGIISEIVPTFSRKPLFAYHTMVIATAAIGHPGLPGLGPSHVRDGYGHRSDAVLHVRDHAGRRADRREDVQLDRNDVGRLPVIRDADAVCDRVLVRVPLGGVTGVILAVVAVNIQLQDTYYVVAHFHYVMVAGSLFGLFAGTYYWLPKWTGHMYDETLDAGISGCP